MNALFLVVPWSLFIPKMKIFIRYLKNIKRKVVLYVSLICNKNKLVLTRLVKLFGSIEHLICIGLYRFQQF